MKELNRICSSFVNMIRYDRQDDLLEKPQSMMEREAEENTPEALE
ncbi:hypothetical protein PSI19_10940 [Xenorhabdus khoisanae]|nr:hypothetical protein [Xenorhabdus khoisanae]MDC9614377.1 hypothetical protein [Xenorhabdus khoisanae]